MSFGDCGSPTCLAATGDDPDGRSEVSLETFPKDSGHAYLLSRNSLHSPKMLVGVNLLGVN